MSDDVIHSGVARLTNESTACTFCAAEGDLEIGLLCGFYWGAHAVTNGAISLCDAHRIRLSFYFDLTERILLEVVPGKKAST